MTALDNFDFTPAPPDVADRINPELVEAGLLRLMQGDKDLLVALGDGRLRWMLHGFDSAGLADVQIVWASTGETVASCVVHWSAICGDPRAT